MADSAFHDKSVADVSANLRLECRASDMLGDWDAQMLSQHAVAFDVFLLDRTFPDRDLGVLLKPLAEWPYDGRVESEVVEVEVQ